ncbi:hypothetical protein [Streptacidiphilus sp. PAMC 29251]
MVTLVLSVLAVGTAVAVLMAPQLVGLYMPDTPGNHQLFELTVTFARFLLPQVFALTVVTRYANAADAQLPRAGGLLCLRRHPHAVLDGRVDLCLRRMEGRLDGKRLLRTYGKLALAGATAGVVGWGAAHACPGAVVSPAAGSAIALIAGGGVMLALFLLLARLLRISELRGLRGLRE